MCICRCCFNQLKLHYTAVTNSPQISVIQSSRFISQHLPISSQAIYGSTPCQLHPRTQSKWAASIWNTAGCPERGTLSWFLKLPPRSNTQRFHSYFMGLSWSHERACLQQDEKWTHSPPHPRPQRPGKTCEQGDSYSNCDSGV